MKRNNKSSATSSKKTRRKKVANSHGTRRITVNDLKLEAAKTANNLFPIVGIGASAGGLEAFTRLIQNLPAETGMAFVLVQHLDPEHESKLPQILARVTAMPVLEVRNNTPVESNHIYVIPPNRTMTIERRVLKLLARAKADGRHHAIDHFFESLASDQRHQAIGVILSGTATDGTIGLQAIKGEGGITFAQDESAKYDSMPRSAVAAGDVDFILPPEKIAAELARIAEHPYVASEDKFGETTAEESEPEIRGSEREALQKILTALRNHSGVDFSLYRGNTIRRRIMRRMLLAKVKTLIGYANHLRQNGGELETLYQDLLIAVTSFFRSPQAFDLLKHKVFPKLMKNRSPNDAVRVWTVGCSTGQEAYSIAMSFLEYASGLSQNVNLQIFATDVNDALLEKARAGLYSKSLVQDVSPDRLRRFFVEEQGGYRVSKTIREMCVFARQNVVADPPFSRMDLISCRNLLIYMEPELQRRLLPTFHYALKREGFLILGVSESIGEFASLFTPVDKKLKIFAKKPGTAHHIPQVALTHGVSAPKVLQNKAPELRDLPVNELTAQREADRLSLARYGPPGVVINAGLEILQFRGDTSPYLVPPRGRASFNLLKMAREGLMLPLRAAINKAKKEDRLVRKEDVRVNQNGSTRVIHLEVTPLKNVTDPCLLVVFEPGEIPARKDATRPAKHKTLSKRSREPESRKEGRLQQELDETLDYLQAIQEQYDAANEELQASGEEMQSANEELQSINEELETSKEELESSNEELTTVNDEMANRNAELTSLNNDVVNLQSSINLAVLLLGRDLSIRRFTQPAEKIFNLLPTDIGRPITVIRHNLDLPNLEEMIVEVIESVAAQEHEIHDKEGRCFLLRVRPYMTIDNKIDGAVLLLIDITIQKQAEEARSYLAAIVDSSDDAIFSKDVNGIITSWNRGAERLFGYSAEEAIGKSVAMLIPTDRIGEGPGILERIRQGESIEHYETIRRRKDGTLANISLTISPIYDANKRVVGASKIARDITSRKRDEQERARLLAIAQNARAEAEAANRVKDEFLAIVSHEVRTPLNAISGWVQMLRSGMLNDEQIAKALETIDRNAASQAQIIAELLDTSRIVSGTLRIEKKPIALASLVEAAIEILRPAADAKSIQIETSLDPAVKPVWGDSGRLQQVFWNLLSNAIKFTPKEGRVEIRLERADSNVEIVVEDNGDGIAPEFLPFIFERFRQADSTAARLHGGLGLGLSIVRSIVELHGGSVRAESEGTGRGAAFTVTLPVMPLSSQVSNETTVEQQSANEPPTFAVEDGARLDGVRILVVDDDTDTRELLGVVLSGAGAEVKTCASSSEALTTLKEWQADCIVSDIGMPGEDGYDLMKKVRALDKKAGGNIPAIAVTGFAASGDQSRSRAVGYQVHISKPVELSKLTSEIAQLVQKK